MAERLTSDSTEFVNGARWVCAVCDHVIVWKEGVGWRHADSPLTPSPEALDDEHRPRYWRGGGD